MFDIQSPQINLPKLPQQTSNFKPLVTPSGLSNFFGSVGSGIKSFFTPKATNFQAPVNPLANLGQGYQPLGLSGGLPVPPASAFNIQTPQATQPSPTHTVTTTTKTTPLVQQNSGTSTAGTGMNQPATQNLASSSLDSTYGSNQPTPTPAPASFGNSVTSDTGTIPSTAFSSSSTYQDVIAKRATYEKAYQDALLAQANTQVQGLQNVQDARYMGDTQSFASGMGERAQNNANLANLAATSKANAYGTLLGVNQNDVTNALNAAPTTQGLQTSANGDVYSQTRNPVTGATEITAYGNIYNGTFSGQPIKANANNFGGGQTQQNGGTAFPSSTGLTSNMAIPTQLQGAVYTAPNGQAYVAEDKLTPGLQTMQTIAAKNAGIPILSTDQVASVRNVDYVKQQIGGIQSIIGGILSGGTTGRIKDLVLNPIKDFLQTDTNISTFNAYRETAINTIQSLAGGAGSGLRLTTGEIAQASANIPEITDNLETARAKLDKLNTFLDNKMATVLPPIAGNEVGNKTTGTNIIQTKIGAVDNSWFQ
jgi:hypothetical protein